MIDWERKVLKFLLLCTTFLSFTHVQAQVQSNQGWNLPNYDNRAIHYGFHIGFNYSQFRVKHNQDFVNQDSVQAVYSVGSPSVSLGFVFNLRLSEFFDLRFLPTAALYERKLNFHFESDPALTKSHVSSFIEFPFLLKYKSSRRKNMRMYIVGGIKPGMTVGLKKSDEGSNEASRAKYDCTLDIGLGTDIYYPLFKFAPELRFSLGLMNLLANSEETQLENENIDRLSSYTITLLFSFE